VPVRTTSTTPATKAPEVVFEPDEAPTFAAGSRVSHRLFGEGTVVGQRGGGRSATVVVRFDGERGPRVIAARFLQT
jgi:hypothetical protein